VNVVGRVQNNNYERDGETVYTMAFTAEEIDYLDTKAEGEALRGGEANAKPKSAKPAASSAEGTGTTKAARGRKAAKVAAALDEDDIPF
jgi:single-strand DNA-binding protein